jgi:hypothetical protein
MQVEPLRHRVRDLADTPGLVRSRRLRRRIERLFGQLKRNMGMRRLKLRGLRSVAEVHNDRRPKPHPAYQEASARLKREGKLRHVAARNTSPHRLVDLTNSSRRRHLQQPRS